MIQKEELCKAFCDDLVVTEVPAGLAVSTTFVGHDGDRIGFYVVGPDANGLYRIEDDGALMPFLKAAGADTENKIRSEVFNALLKDYEASFDENTLEIKTAGVRPSAIPSAALRFVNLIIRVQDILFMAYRNSPSGGATSEHPSPSELTSPGGREL